MRLCGRTIHPRTTQFATARPTARAGPRIGPRVREWLITALLAVASTTTSVHAFQPAGQGPVATMDDSILAREGLPRVRELAAAGNYPEALRILQNLLDNDAERVIESPRDANLHTTVRSQVNALLAETPELFKRYRDQEAPKAQALLDAGDFARAETTRFLTQPGLIAAARLAQQRLDFGRFESARLTLQPILSHPDLESTRDALTIAASASATLAKILPRDDTNALAAAFRDRATRANITLPEVLASPLPQGVQVLTPMDAGPALDSARVASTALRSIPLDNPAANDPSEFAGYQRGMPRKEEAIVFPTHSGDLLLINDGRQITALEHDTFSPRWSITPGDTMDIVPKSDDPFAFYTAGRAIEDPASVAVSTYPRANVAIAVTGIARNGRRTGDGRAHGIDVESGRVLWSVEPQLLGPGYEGSSIRGPAVIENDTVILAVRKQGQGARDTTVLLLGLDLYTGKERWSRTLGVVGRLPWQVAQRRADAITLHDGIAYYTDEIGVAAAVEASTGRAHWVRRLPTAGSFNARSFGRGETFPPHSIHAPIFHAGNLFILDAAEADRQRVLQLNAATGEITAARDATAFGRPRYLIRVGEHLAAVGENRVSFVRLTDFESGTISTTPSLVPPTNTSDGTIIGRAVAAGNQTIVPLQGAIGIIENPQKPESVRFVPVEGSGNVLVAGGSVITADLSQLRSYVRWEEASALLRARIERDPHAIDAMLAFVDLSLKADRPADAVDVARQALDALDIAGTAGAPNGASLSTPSANRRRLFDTLFPILIGKGDKPMPPGVQDQLILSLDRAAEEPAERATFLLSLASLRAWRHDETKAVESYQAILADDRLANADPLPIAGVRPGRSAGEEATIALFDIVTRTGANVYASFADEATRAARSLPAQSSPDELVRLAMRYPLSPAAVEMWRRTGERLFETGRFHASSRALGKALTTAEALVVAGRGEEYEAVGTVGMQLAASLEAAGMKASSHRLLSRLLRESPMSLIIAGHAPSEIEERCATIEREIAQGRNTPQIGAGLDQRSIAGMRTNPPQALVNWHPAECLLGQGDGTPTDCIPMTNPSTGEIALFILRPETGEMESAWTRPYHPFAPTVLRADLHTTYLFWPGTRGGAVEAIDSVDGTTRWKTPEFSSLFSEEPKRPAGDRFPAPVAGDVRASDLVVSMDDNSLLLIERGGRAAAFDLVTGNSLWVNALPLTRVYDVAGSGPTLVAAGVVDNGAEELPPSIITIEKRTGKPGPSVNLTDGESAKLVPEEHVRWLRADTKGRVVVALATGLACIDPATGATIWDQRHGGIKGTPLSASVAGLLIDGSILVLDGDRQLHMVPLETGETQGTILSTDVNKQSKLEFPIRLSECNGSIVLTGSRGVLVYDLKGQLVGTDSLDPDLLLTTPLLTRSGIVAMTQMPAGHQPLPGRVPAMDDGSYEVYFLDLPSARMVARHEVLVAEEPGELAAVDGKLLISAGGITFVLDVPPDALPRP